jgi:hypothetical protein
MADEFEMLSLSRRRGEKNVMKIEVIKMKMKYYIYTLQSHTDIEELTTRLMFGTLFRSINTHLTKETVIFVATYSK